MTREAPSSIETFHGAVSIVLRDGELTQEEKRLIIKLAGLLGLEAHEPKLVYDAVLSGEVAEGGRALTRAEQLAVYEGLFETAFLNASISEDEYLVVAYIRHVFDIGQEEHDRIMEGLQKTLEEHVERNVLHMVRDRFDDTLDQVTGLFDNIRSILPEGGR